MKLWSKFIDKMINNRKREVVIYAEDEYVSDVIRTIEQFNVSELKLTATNDKSIYNTFSFVTTDEKASLLIYTLRIKHRIMELGGRYGSSVINVFVNGWVEV